MKKASKAHGGRVALQPHPAGADAGRQRVWLWPFPGALALALMAFGPAINGTFIFDDNYLPFGDFYAGRMPAGFWIGGVRPALMATYWANFLVSGVRPFSYHAVNIALHATTAVLVFFIFERMLEISAAKCNRCLYSLIGATIFLLHPLQTESVDYIAGRSELLSGLFVCAGWLVFLNHFKSETSIGTSLKIIALSGLAVFSKESAIAFPAVMIATDLFWSNERPAKWFRRRARLYIPLACGTVLASLLILWRLSFGGGAGSSAGVSPLNYALTECRVILIYIRLFFFPAGQNGDWRLPFFHSVARDQAWVYVLAFLMLIATVVWLFPRKRLVSFGLLVFLLLLMPTSSVAPIKDALAERRMYMPLAGLILALLAAAMQIRLRTRTLLTIAIPTLAVLGWLSWHRSAVWIDDRSFWQDAVRQNPKNGRAHFSLSAALLLRRDCAGAVREYNLGESNEPPGDESQWNLAEAYECLHKTELALNLFRSLAARRHSPDVYERIGYIEATEGHIDAAFAAFEEALRIDPNDATAYAYRGTGKIAIQDLTGAEADLRKALELEPANQKALEGVRLLAQARK